MLLSPEEIERYQRHLVLKGFGGSGQQKLKAARVLVIGAGGLGSPILLYLAAAGVGTIGIVDPDTVSRSNLQRQVAHGTADIGRPKVESAADLLRRLNPNTAIKPIRLRLEPENARSILAGFDLVVEGSDNFATRKAVAEAADALEKPLVSGAVSMFDGQVTALAPFLRASDGALLPRFCDLYPEQPDDALLPSCEAVGVLGVTTGVIGSLMAAEAIKLITGAGEPLFGRLLLYDGRGARFTELRYKRKPGPG